MPVVISFTLSIEDDISLSEWHYQLSELMVIGAKRLADVRDRHPLADPNRIPHLICLIDPTEKH